jgi:hypothetical protein
MGAAMVQLKQPNQHIEYTEAEQKLFRLLPVNPRGVSRERIDTKKLTKRFYSRGSVEPFYGQNRIIALLRSLMRKAEWNQEPFKIMKSERRGPNAIEVWVER